MNRSIDDPKGYQERIRPMFTELYRMAHAVAGNGEVAEYVLRRAMVEAYLRRREWRDRMGFSEGLRHTVRMVALAELRGLREAGSYDEDWAHCVPGGLNAAESRLLHALEAQGDWLLRYVLLIYGCELKARQAADVLCVPEAKAQAKLRALKASAGRRAAQGGQRQDVNDLLRVISWEMLKAKGGDVPDMAQLFRLFERDIEGAKKPRATFGRMAGYALRAVGALLIAVLFYLCAVLMEPGILPAREAQAIREGSASAGQLPPNSDGAGAAAG